MYKKKRPYGNRKSDDYEQYKPGATKINGQRDAGLPSKEEPNGVAMGLNTKALRDLRYGASITVKSNPSAEASKGADPYAIINRLNPIIDASYPGEGNLAGNSVMQLVNNSTSRLLAYYDVGSLNLGLNYLYCAISATDKNQANNIQMGKSISEALSHGYAEQFIDLPFFKYEITTDMPSCDAANRLAFLTWYQTALQNVASCISKYNVILSLEKHLADMSYNREVPLIIDLFGLFKKSSFRSKWQALGTYLLGEYFDTEWLRQINTLTMVPSRKYNAITDPLLTLNSYHKMPKVSATLSEVSVFDSDDYTIEIGDTDYTISDLTLYIHELLSPRRILEWARQLSNGIISTTTTEYFNLVDTALTALKTIMIPFPDDMGELRSVLSVMARVGLCSWTKGIGFKTDMTGSYTPVYNKLVADVFAGYLASADSMIWDSSTLRWKFYTVWDKIMGIPEFDRYSGGAFLTFSVRNLPLDTDYTSDRWLIPKLFDLESNTVRVTSRVGLTITLSYYVMNNAALNNSYILSRLNPLDRSDISVRIPSGSVLTAGNIPVAASSLYVLMQEAFRFGRVEVSSGVFDYTISPDAVCFIDAELDDISNSMITYARTRAPFRVQSLDKTVTIGFN